jgi:hypothetical protein
MAGASCGLIGRRRHVLEPAVMSAMVDGEGSSASIFCTPIRFESAVSTGAFGQPATAGFRGPSFAVDPSRGSLHLWGRVFDRGAHIDYPGASSNC